jgi:hypothetical protein
VIDLENHSTLAVMYHLRDQGYGSIPLWSPHSARFRNGQLIYVNPWESLTYLFEDTDSLVAVWDSLAGGSFVLLANDPSDARGPLVGAADKAIGTGSDMISDLDLASCLEVGHVVEEIQLRGSGGPFSVFLVRRR